MLHTPEFAKLACELYQVAGRYRQALGEEMGPIRSVRIEGGAILSEDHEGRGHTVVIGDQLLTAAFPGPEPASNAGQGRQGYRYTVEQSLAGQWTVFFHVPGRPAVSVGGSRQREQAGQIAHSHRDKTAHDHPEWRELDPISYYPYGSPR